MTRSNLAYSYVRFSRPEQLRGDSLRRQKEQSQKWCAENGYILDTVFRLEDRGVSAFKGDNAVKGKLGAFRDAIRAGKVKPGSVLIVESLDRISRQAALTSIGVISEILTAGIEIVTLSPYERFTAENVNDGMRLVIVVVILSRAYEESAVKSHRLKESWINKRRRISQGMAVRTRRPSWISFDGDKYVFNEKVGTVRRIARMYLDGHGVVSIARTFNKEKVPCLGTGKQRAKTWSKSTILKILRSRTMIGEHQPHLGRSNQDQSKRVAIGEPIPGYFPAAICEADFYRVQKRLNSRVKNSPVRNPSSVTNLFQGVIRDARDGSAMQIVDKGTRGSGRQLVSGQARNGAGVYAAFPYAAVEITLLQLMKSVTASDILPTQGQADLQEEYDKLTGELGDANNRIAKIQKQLEKSDVGLIETLLPVMSNLSATKKELDERLQRLEAELSSTLPTVRDCQSLVELLSGEDADDHRRRFRAVFRQLVERVDCLVLVAGHWRQAFLQVHFCNGRKRLMVAATHRANLVCCAGYDGAKDLSDKSFRSHVEQRLAELKVRSVQRTKRNLEDQLIYASVGVPGVIQFGSGPVVLDHEASIQIAEQ